MKKQALFNKSCDQSKPDPLPLNIGVTGHRDLCPEDKAKLFVKVHSVFINLQKKYPNTSFILYSPLAEGADRLVAEAALEVGCRLIVPLPLEQEEFERDFSNDGSREDFRRLLSRADRTFVVPFVDGSTAENVRDHGKNRDLHYDRASAYIVSNCPILIALWDGKEKNHISKVIKWHKYGLPEPYASLFGQSEPVDKRTVYQIVTPRISNPNPPDAFSIKLPLFSEADGRRDNCQICGKS